MEDQELISFLKEIIKLQSYDPTNSELPEFIVNKLSSYGIDSMIEESNGYKSIVAKTKGTPKVLFNGHWDTVLPGKKFKKKVQSCKEDSEYIYGLGACDMKSGVAAIVGMFIEASKQNIEGVMINLVPDEELGGENGTRYLISKGYVAPNVVLCEPTNLNISLGQKGAVFTDIIARGLSGHGAYPNRGINAIMKIVDFANRLKNIYPDPKKDATNDEVFNMVTASLHIIKGGSARNVIPDLCSGELDVRVPPHIKIDDVIKNLKEIADEAGIEINSQNMGSGWELNKETRLFDCSVKAIEDTGLQANYVKKMGSNDGKYYAEVGSNIINIGPGDNKLSHTEFEKVSKDELVQAKNIYLLISKTL
jgi:succinyl-diaminopimelate desuccinylase